MGTQTKTNGLVFDMDNSRPLINKNINYALQSFSKDSIDSVIEKTNAFQGFLKESLYPKLDILLARLASSVSKKSFLVFKHNKYITVPTENIAFFYVNHESSMIVCFDRQEYFVNYSLEQIQSLLAEKDFFRLNRQYLINFNAVKEAEHYFARKLLVNLIVPAKEKLLVSKEKVSTFLQWLDNR